VILVPAAIGFMRALHKILPTLENCLLKWLSYLGVSSVLTRMGNAAANVFIGEPPHCFRFLFTAVSVEHWDCVHPQRGCRRARDWRGAERPRRSRGGTPAKPGFRRSRKCAQMRKIRKNYGEVKICALDGRNVL
jgi:hypothetical protein